VDASAVDQVKGVVCSNELTASRAYLGWDPLAVLEMPAPFDFPPGKQFRIEAGIACLKLPMRGAFLIQVAPDCRVPSASIEGRSKSGPALIAGAPQTARKLLI
jgi:hypothetical protein